MSSDDIQKLATTFFIRSVLSYIGTDIHKALFIQSKIKVRSFIPILAQIPSQLACYNVL